MRTAFERAVEISYYAGKLWDIATNPDIARGETPVDYTATHVLTYPGNDTDNFFLSGRVGAHIISLFEDAARVGVAENDNLARNSLRNAISVLGRVIDLKDPFPRYTTSFSNLQMPLKGDMAHINAIAEGLNLGRD